MTTGSDSAAAAPRRRAPGRLALGILLGAAALGAACQSDTPPQTPAPGGNTGETITGRERIGWDQSAANAAELASFRYAIYVDGSRREMTGVTCAAPAGGSSACNGPLPAMSPGTHVLEIAAFTTDVEGTRSAPLRVTVTGAGAPADGPPLADGDRISTADGVQLTAALLVEGMDDVTDMSLAPDGRLVVAERSGCLHLIGERMTRACPAVVDEVLSVALAPDFPRTGFLYLMHTQRGAFRVARYRLVEDQLVERMLVLPDVPASEAPAAILRFGPDGKLYAAFDDGGSRDAAERLSDWNGKILRVNPDGRTPDDQPAASPVFWSGLASPRGLDWRPDGGALWMAEASADGVERIRALVTGDERPRRAGQRASYVLGRGIGASSLAYYRGDVVPQFRGDMFIAAREENYLLRVRFDAEDPMRAVTTEKLLEGRSAGIRAVVTAADGTIYVATASDAWSLTPVRERR